MNLAEELLEIAERDLEASRILHKNKLYPQAAFYFAQSVEKANKSLATLLNNHNEKYLSDKIGHEAIIIHQKSSRRAQQKFGKFLKQSEKHPIYKDLPFFQKEEIKNIVQQSNLAIQTIDEIKEQSDDLIFIKATAINQLLKEIQDEKNQITEEMDTFLKLNIDKNEWSQNVNQIVEWVEKNNFPQEAVLKFKEEAENINFDDAWDALKNYYIINYKNALLTIPLFYLAVITLPLANIARYPEKGKSPLEIFTWKSPLVRKLPSLFEVHLQVIHELREFHELWNNTGDKLYSDTSIDEG
ncbi:HEPN domain-containing protein [Methanohalophilus levihalophilus]|uniref:HEPN domain-containing protein n=1 Tax=Methanohalophilus levihalophilus TaxID=1431282 RepID=UPI001AEB5B11|nr:HEPN domain-containing protein [Methanohalophilus levihalophilus]MBP2030665.1 HEPN domain-containing protein [Methanohalophilus levihalophilus]